MMETIPDVASAVAEELVGNHVETLPCTRQLLDGTRR